MAEIDHVFVFIGTYDSTEAAWQDYELVKELHSRGVDRYVRRRRCG